MRSGSAYIAAHQTTVDRLPIEHMSRGRHGSRSGLSERDRAKLDDMRAELLALLRGHGVSRAWITDRTGIPRNHITAYLYELGAKRSSGWGLWRLPSLARLRSSL